MLTSNVPTLPAPANEPYSEPLRYQKGQSRTPAQTAPPQSDVDKIVSAYGVGPTDDKGMPLFGLRALKRRSPAVTGTCFESTERSEQRVSKLHFLSFLISYISLSLK